MTEVLKYLKLRYQNCVHHNNVNLIHRIINILTLILKLKVAYFKKMNKIEISN
jgi:hypothetical protein